MTEANLIGETESIERDPGTTTGMGAVVGAGYRGKRDDQDEAVKELARRLNEEFPHDVTIRFNTDQLSGGAWLKDDDRSSQVGLGVSLRPPEWYLEQRDEWLYKDGEEPNRYDISLEERQLVIQVKLWGDTVNEEHINRERENRTSYAIIEFDGVDTAWEWFIKQVNRDEINPPA